MSVCVYEGERGLVEGGSNKGGDRLEGRGGRFDRGEAAISSVVALYTFCSASVTQKILEAVQPRSRHGYHCGNGLSRRWNVLSFRLEAGHNGGYAECLILGSEYPDLRWKRAPGISRRVRRAPPQTVTLATHAAS